MVKYSEILLALYLFGTKVFTAHLLVYEHTTGSQNFTKRNFGKTLVAFKKVGSTFQEPHSGKIAIVTPMGLQLKCASPTVVTETVCIPGILNIIETIFF